MLVEAALDVLHLVLMPMGFFIDFGSFCSELTCSYQSLQLGCLQRVLEAVLDGLLIKTRQRMCMQLNLCLLSCILCRETIQVH